MQGKDSKDRLWGWKDVNKTNKKKKSEGEIKFRQDTTKKNLIMILKGTALVLIAMISGYISSYYFVNNLYKSIAKNGGTQTIILEKDPSNTNFQMNSIYTIVQNAAPSVVGIGSSEESFVKNPLDNTGNVSGFVIRSDGYIVTNYHSIEKFQQILVKLPGQGSKPFHGKLVGFDKASDIALIKIEAVSLPVAKLGKLSNSKIGDMVISIANSKGEEYIGTVTTGIISSTNKKMEVGDAKSGEKNAYAILQTDLSLNIYNNGGIICNSAGEILGINSKKIDGKFNAQGLSHSIAVEEIKKIVDSILSFGEVKRPSLGFKGGTLIPKEAGDIEGVYVQSVTQDSGAAKAGIKATDIIIELDNKKIKKLEEIYTILEKKKVGDIVSCKIWRDGKAQELSVELGEANS
ncbi:S1C family serine protease [Clostridium polynesiense]|uniref:S1C family serine protease n=1 Tax=Clostridium polynesiense TaxID=1325933 RepID=UPI00164D04CB|nr:S1C family serine protease [Clostridium polynesiense]